jgi:hypothetical protein
MEKYSSMTIVDLGGGWRARLRHKEGGVWRRDPRDFEAAWGPETPVCTNSFCRRLNPRGYSRWVESWMVGNGMAKRVKGDDGVVRYHGPSNTSLRHAQNSTLSEEHIPLKQAQNRAGHTTPTTTLNDYVRDAPTDRESANVIDNVLRRGVDRARAEQEQQAEGAPGARRGEGERTRRERSVKAVVSNICWRQSWTPAQRTAARGTENKGDQPLRNKS